MKALLSSLLLLLLLLLLLTSQWIVRWRGCHSRRKPEIAHQSNVLVAADKGKREEEEEEGEGGGADGGGGGLTPSECQVV